LQLRASVTIPVWQQQATLPTGRPEEDAEERCIYKKSYTISSPQSIDDERMNRVDQELIEAAKMNNLPEVSRLLGVGADVNTKDNRGSTPLYFAILRGHVQVFKELVKHGADIDAKDSGCWTPLHWACLKGHVVVVNELLSPNDSNGAPTSILGKRKSRRGADVDAKDRHGRTPLHIVSCCGHFPVIKALLSGGADILAANNAGRLPFHEAVRFRRLDVAKYLLQQLYATTRRLPLHELVEDLTWIGNPNSRDAPPLRAALDQNLLRTNDVVEILEFLVCKNPALLCSRDQDGSLALHVACRSGVSFTVVQSLVNHDKASVKSVTPQGDLPLFLACEMPETSLDTIFLLMKQYPELVYR
jgi:ankyrin repeat protein